MVYLKHTSEGVTRMYIQSTCCSKWKTNNIG